MDPRGSVVGLLTHAKVNNDIEGIVMEATTNVAAATGNPFRYDGGEYIYYNWSTKARTQGTHSVHVDLGDGASHAVTISPK